MAKRDPIILIEDDIDDQEMFSTALQDLNVNNPLQFFSDPRQALLYLKSTTDQPFIIFCDINLPIMSGLELKQLVDADPELRRKCIPFIFYSTSAQQSEVNKAYMNMTIQGFFEKPTSYSVKLDLIGRILSYWEACKHPNA